VSAVGKGKLPHTALEGAMSSPYTGLKCTERSGSALSCPAPAMCLPPSLPKALHLTCAREPSFACQPCIIVQPSRSILEGKV